MQQLFHYSKTDTIESLFNTNRAEWKVNSILFSKADGNEKVEISEENMNKLLDKVFSINYLRSPNIEKSFKGVQGLYIITLENKNSGEVITYNFGEKGRVHINKSINEKEKEFLRLIPKEEIKNLKAILSL